MIILGGCQNVGPIAIDQGRDRYNNIIHSTAKQQTFANIIRVKNHEPTLFMDVSEVDATTTFAGTVTGGLANIGAKPGTSGGTLAGQTGAVAGGVTYSESPLIRYTPLLGQPLVAQLATSVSPDALASLYDSNWGVAPVLDFATAYMTLDFDETYGALNAIAELDRDSRVELVAEKSDVTKSKDSTKTTPLQKGQPANVTLQVTNKAASPGGTDALVIYYMPYHPHEKHHASKENYYEDALWSRLRTLYAGTQAVPTLSDDAKCPSGSCPKVALDPNKIELRTTPVAAANMASRHLISGAPLMRTYSALGILKNATEQPQPRIAFVTPDLYWNIRSLPWNNLKTNSGLTFYTLLAKYENEGDEKSEDPNVDKTISDWLWNKQSQFVYLPKNRHISDDEYVKVNQRLGHLRRYILVIMSNNPPVDAYVAHFDQGTWYYIDRDDTISQKNFDLISLFLTMMAVPPTTQPLTPAISVGGG